jgi:hypothetical protein
MTRQAWTWFIPLIAVVVGLVVYYKSRPESRNPTIGGYIFLCGFFILLWLVTFGGLPQP